MMMMVEISIENLFLSFLCRAWLGVIHPNLCRVFPLSEATHVVREICLFLHFAYAIAWELTTTTE